MANATKMMLVKLYLYNHAIINRLKEKITATWSRSKGCWYISVSKFRQGDFFEVFKNLACIDYSGLQKKTTHTVGFVKPTKKPSDINLPNGYIENWNKKDIILIQLRYMSSIFNEFINHFARTNRTQYSPSRSRNVLIKVVAKAEITKKGDTSYVKAFVCHTFT